MSTSDQKEQDVHFVVLTHGLWGSPKHLDNVANALKSSFSDKSLHILITKSNEGNFTYDGIETGAERVTQEIEQELESLKKDGKNVTKFSVIGYSLGGLIARYSIGLLYSKGLFKTAEPINFTTFATPHLGVRAPLVGWSSQFFNYVGSRTLSASGHQLWLLDKFRETDRPLLSLLADPDSVFIKALSAFKYRNLYANVVNDRAVPFYTGYISRTDPFTDINEIEINYDPKYERVILDTAQPAKPRTTALTLYEAFANRSSSIGVQLPFYIFVGLLSPIWSFVYLANSGIQSYQSAGRIKEHQAGNTGISTTAYRVPFMLEGVQRRAEQALQHLNNMEREAVLPLDEQPNINSEDPDSKLKAESATTLSSGIEESTESEKAQGKSSGSTQPLQADFPHLALTPEQFAIADSLDEVGFTKHAVYIHRVSHSHAAIIVRSQRIGFGEGKVVIRHFIERFKP